MKEINCNCTCEKIIGKELPLIENKENEKEYIVEACKYPTIKNKARMVEITTRDNNHSIIVNSGSNVEIETEDSMTSITNDGNLNKIYDYSELFRIKDNGSENIIHLKGKTGELEVNGDYTKIFGEVEDIGIITITGNDCYVNLKGKKVIVEVMGQGVKIRMNKNMVIEFGKRCVHVDLGKYEEGKIYEVNLEKGELIKVEE